METEKCQGCGELDYNAYEKSRSRWRSNDRGPRRWTATFDQLRKGEVDGCHYCRVILQGAKWAWGENPEVVGEELGHPHWRCKDYYRICPFETLYVLRIDIRPGRRLIAWRECPSQGTSSGELGGLRPNPTDVDFIEFYTPKGTKVFHPAFGIGLEVPLKLSLEHTLCVVKPWLLECDNLHPACQESARMLPRRLIDITETPRLIETSITGLASDTKYATLSYRWGEADDAAAMPKTLSTNILKRIESIAWGELPQAFRDAMEISRALGCGYIWIDAFCIIQDDEDDWREQSVLMSQVYSCAYFNLAASALENTLGSMFQNRTCRTGQSRYRGTSLMDIHRVTGFPATDTEVCVRRSYDRQHHDLYGSTLTHAKTRSNTLLDRGWVFQERLLSRRTIHIGLSEIMWECGCCYRCECGTIASVKPEEHESEENVVMIEDLAGAAAGIMRDPDFIAGNFKVQKALLKNACSPGTPAKEVFNFWLQAVEQYSILQLTDESDRLVALGGIARKIQEATGFTYLAGLWLEDLPRALYWCGSGVHLRNTRSKAKQTPRVIEPSWSWVSRRPGSRLQHIDWANLKSKDFQQDSRLRINKSETFCRYIGDSPFGQVLSGQIQMSAAYVRGRVTKTGDFDYVYIDIGPLAQRIIPPPDSPNSKGDTCSKTAILVDPDAPINSLNGSWAESVVGIEVFCLLLGRIGTIDNRRQKNVHYSTQPFFADHDCVLVVMAHPDNPQKYLRFGSHDVGSARFGSSTQTLFSPYNMEELYKDADVKVFNLV